MKLYLLRAPIRRRHAIIVAVALALVSFPFIHVPQTTGRVGYV